MEENNITVDGSTNEDKACVVIEKESQLSNEKSKKEKMIFMKNKREMIIAVVLFAMFIAKFSHSTFTKYIFWVDDSQKFIVISIYLLVLLILVFGISYMAFVCAKNSKEFKNQDDKED